MTVRRSVAYWAIGGLVVPVAILFLNEFHGRALYWPRLAFALWPSSLILMALEGKGGILTPSGFMVFVISIGINVALYSLVGALAGLLSSLVRHFPRPPE